MQKRNIEKTAHLVVGSIDPDKETQIAHVQDYEQACRFAEEQPLEHNVTFTWHYLDPLLSRKFSICFARRAIRLQSDFLEIPRFVARATEPILPSYEILMGGFCLKTSTIHNPGDLYQKYATLRERMIDQDSVEFGESLRRA